MADNPFDVPQQVRDTAERSVEQARDAVDKFLDATSKAVESSDQATRAASDNATDMSRQTLAFMEDSIAATFDLAQRVVQARTVEEISALQQEYFNRQAASAAKQGKEMGEAVSRMASDAMENVKK